MRQAFRALLLATVLGLLLSGCARGQSSNSDPEQEDSITPPEEGACRLLTVEDLGLPNNTTRTVDCSGEHNAVTMSVGELPAAYVKEAWDSDVVASVSFALCAGKFAEYVGADESVAMRTILSFQWFRPSEKAWKEGARWYRCDLVGGSGTSDELLNLPENARGVLAPESDMRAWMKRTDAWMACVAGDTVQNAPRTPCSEPHSWRAVTTIKLADDLENYPGDEKVVKTTRDFCSDSVAGWLGYPADFDFAYTVFGQAEWEQGNRRSICWARTER